jgi:hypothetical protein
MAVEESVQTSRWLPFVFGYCTEPDCRIHKLPAYAMTTFGQVTSHGQFPAPILRRRAAAPRGHIWAKRQFGARGPRNAFLSTAGRCRRDLPHAEPKRSAE